MTANSDLERLGEVFKAFRDKDGLTQDDLAKRCGDAVSRTAVALFEQGRRLPSPEALRELATVLKVPEELWKTYATPSISQRLEFELLLSELVGKPITLRPANTEEAEAVEKLIVDLFSQRQTLHQAYDLLNSILIYYGIPRMAWAFFKRYFTVPLWEG